MYHKKTAEVNKMKTTSKQCTTTKTTEVNILF